MNEYGERTAIPLDRGDGTRRTRFGQLDPLARTVHVRTGFGQPVADPQRRVAERASERVSQRARRDVAELDHQVRHGRALPRRSQQPDEQADRDGDERRLVREEEPLVRLPVGERESAGGNAGKAESERRGRLERLESSPPLPPYRLEIVARGNTDDQAGKDDARDLAAPERSDERRHIGGCHHRTTETRAKPAARVSENAVDERAAVEKDERLGETPREPGETRRRHQQTRAALAAP